MGSLTYGQFSAALQARGATSRAPLNGTIEVTHRCPLGCAHCYNNLPMGDSAAREEELSLDEHRRLVDELVEAGTLWLLYTGGEVFARPDFLEIYTHAHQRGLLVTIYTNGTLLTPRIADQLAQHRPFSVEVTLYGHTPATFDRLTGVPGSYERCHRGIALLRERGLPVKLKAVAVSVNRHEVADMGRWAEDQGLAFRCDALMSPRIDCGRSPLAVRLSPEEVVRLDLEDVRRREAWEERARKLRRKWEAEEPAPDAHALYQCGGGVSAFSIDPYGRLSLCLLSRQEQYDLRRGSFREGWEQFLLGIRSRRRSRPSRCVGCGLQSMCSMCPANGELENGSPEAPVDFLCHVTHLRAASLGLDPPQHGPCEFCAPGSRRGELLQAAARIRSGGVAPRSGSVLTLPVLNGRGAGC